MIIREGADPRVAEIFYRAVPQAVIPFGLETWVLSADMESTVEGTHAKFLRQITVKQARQNSDRAWVTPRAELVWESAGIQSEMIYIRRRQETV